MNNRQPTAVVLASTPQYPERDRTRIRVVGFQHNSEGTELIFGLIGVLLPESRLAFTNVIQRALKSAAGGPLPTGTLVASLARGP